MATARWLRWAGSVATRRGEIFRRAWKISAGGEARVCAGMVQKGTKCDVSYGGPRSDPSCDGFYMRLVETDDRRHALKIAVHSWENMSSRLFQQCASVMPSVFDYQRYPGVRGPRFLVKYCVGLESVKTAKGLRAINWELERSWSGRR